MRLHTKVQVFVIERSLQQRAPGEKISAPLLWHCSVPMPHFAWGTLYYAPPSLARGFSVCLRLGSGLGIAIVVKCVNHGRNVARFRWFNSVWPNSLERKRLGGCGLYDMGMYGSARHFSRNLQTCRILGGSCTDVLTRDRE